MLEDELAETGSIVGPQYKFYSVSIIKHMHFIWSECLGYMRMIHLLCQCLFHAHFIV